MRAALIVVIALLAIGAFADKQSAALVRFAHASPSTPAVDVWVNGELIYSSVMYGQVSNYILLPPASYAVSIMLTGAPNVTLINDTLQVIAGLPYTFAAAGVAPFNGLVAWADCLTAPAVGTAQFRFVHFSPNAPTVNVLVNNQVVVQNIAFKSASDYVPINIGSASNSIALQVPGQSFQVPLTYLNAAPGMAYTVFAEGYVGGSGIEALQGVIAADI